MKVALFDFCETLANFQTADPFVHFCAKNAPSKKYQRRLFILSFLNSIKLIPFIQKVTGVVSLNKLLTLRAIKGLSESFVKQCGVEYYLSIVKPNLIGVTIEELLLRQKEGFSIYIVSGGYDAYLTSFIGDYNIPLNNLLCSTIQYENGICTGRLQGRDCMNEQKVKVLEKVITSDSIFSVAYSDSISDLPMMKWADEGVVVRNSELTSWDVKHDFKEIIWQ